MLISQPKPLYEYTCAFSLKFPQFCYSERHWFGKDPVFSLIAANNKSFLLCNFCFGCVFWLNSHQEENTVFRYQHVAGRLLFYRGLFVMLLLLLSFLIWNGFYYKLRESQHSHLGCHTSLLVLGVPPILSQKKNPRAPPLLSFSF